MRVSYEVSMVVQEFRWWSRSFGGGPAAAAGIGRRGHDEVEAVPRPATGVIVMSVDDD
jgi:hypothetical protein